MTSGMLLLIALILTSSLIVFKSRKIGIGGPIDPFTGKPLENPVEMMVRDRRSGFEYRVWVNSSTVDSKTMGSWSADTFFGQLGNLSSGGDDALVVVDSMSVHCSQFLRILQREPAERWMLVVD